MPIILKGLMKDPWWSRPGTLELTIKGESSRVTTLGYEEEGNFKEEFEFFSFATCSHKNFS